MNMFRALIQISTSILFLYSIFLPAHAASYTQQSMFDSLLKSETVVKGTVRSVDVVVQHSTGNMYSEVTLSPVDVLTRNGFESVEYDYTVRYWGGSRLVTTSSGKQELEVAQVTGAPHLVEGESVLLFINGNGEAHMPYTHGYDSLIWIEDGGKKLLNGEREYIARIKLNGNLEKVSIKSKKKDIGVDIISYEGVKPVKHDDESQNVKYLSLNGLEKLLTSVMKRQENKHLDKQYRAKVDEPLISLEHSK